MKKSYLLQTLLFAIFLMYSSIYSNEEKNAPSNRILDLDATNSFTSSTDPGWSYTCKDGIEVELISLGLKNNIPASIDISGSAEDIVRIVVEIVYKGNNPGETIEILDADGNSYTANREVPSGGSSSVWYY
ncbi:MAG: hypothetical protein WBM92_11300, partial [Aureibaculum sp.]